MKVSRRDLLAFMLAAAIPGVPAGVLAQMPDPSIRSTESASEVPYLSMPEVQSYIEETVAQTSLPRDYVESVILLASYSPRVEQLMTPKPRDPSKPKTASRGNWASYRKRMVGGTRVKRGLRFLEENDDAFEEAEDRFGIPRDVVAAIIGIETVYGRNQGSFRVLDTLCTLSFDYKRRADYFRSELTEFLLLIRQQGFDPSSIYGSFAGAIGMAQFMPSSIRRYAIDLDRDGKADISNSSADAIGSVANYLQKKGWVKGLPVYFPCTPTPKADTSIVDGGLTVSTTFAKALKAGFIPDLELTLTDDEPLMVVDLPYRDSDGEEATEYRLGTRNFQTILTYNHSYFYASAVADLADEIEAESIRTAETEMESSARTKAPAGNSALGAARSDGAATS